MDLWIRVILVVLLILETADIVFLHLVMGIYRKAMERFAEEAKKNGCILGKDDLQKYIQEETRLFH